ncbi:hypothetical protein Ancab_006140 [Ancistrocladus abbreviatus]
MGVVHPATKEYGAEANAIEALKCEKVIAVLTDPLHGFLVMLDMDTKDGKLPQAEPTGEVVDWRSQLTPEARQRIVNKIMETLNRRLSLSDQEGLEKLRKIATSFEERIYTAATSQSEYLRKIAGKMLMMGSRPQITLPDTLPSNFSGTDKSP